MLTDKQKEFCSQYLVDLNATQAAIRAGYKARSAAVHAARMLNKANIQEYISELMEEREKRTEITQDMVLKEYAKLAFFDPQKLYDDSGNLLPVKQLDKDVAAALVSIEVSEIISDGAVMSMTKKVRVSDKKGALDSVARHLGMFNDRLQVGFERIEDIIARINANNR